MAQLQWGRVVEDAETVLAACECARLALLQWGRVVEDAETATLPTVRAGAS